MQLKDNKKHDALVSLEREGGAKDKSTVETKEPEEEELEVKVSKEQSGNFAGS